MTTQRTFRLNDQNEHNPPRTSLGAPLILKFGSSVLQREADIPKVVAAIYQEHRRLRPIIAVVSAVGDATNQLDEQARRLSSEPDEESYAKLLATGEEHAVAVVLLGLQDCGLSAAGLSPEELGITTNGPRLDASPDALNDEGIHQHLAEKPILVVPGFVGLHASGGYSLLGRGGSDLTALFLAHRLKGECRLVKDVCGWFESDPHAPKAGRPPRRYSQLSFAEGEANRAPIVQQKAVRAAASWRQPFRVTSIDHSLGTWVGELETQLAPTPPSAPTKVALAGLGTVGLAVLQRLLALPKQFTVTGILVHNLKKKRPRWVPTKLLVSTGQALVQSRPDVVVELTGDTTLGLDLLTRCAQARCHAITANKELVAKQGLALQKAFANAERSLHFSAAVGGVVPAVEAVRSLRDQGITRIEGVLNGTTNFVLNELARGNSWDSAIARARQLGLAERDLDLDFSGRDAAYKIAILARETWGEDLSQKLIPLKQLQSDADDQATPRRQVAVAARGPKETRASVDLVPIQPGSFLEHIPGAGNVLLIELRSGSRILIKGAGAGGIPTATSVLADLMDVALILRSRTQEVRS